MTRFIQATVAATVAALAVTACSSTSGEASSAGARSAGGAAATSQHAASSTSPTSSGLKIDLATVDVCSLLTSAEANNIARLYKLDPQQTATTVYTFKTEKVAQTNPACRFSIIAPKVAYEGAAAFQLQSARYFIVGSGDKRISGFGDEAYTNGGAPVVRIGNVELMEEDGFFSDAITRALMKKIIAHLRGAA